MKNFSSPEAALNHFETKILVPEQTAVPIPRFQDKSTQTDVSMSDIGMMTDVLNTLSEDQRIDVVGKLFQSLAPPGVSVPPNFIKNSLTSMRRLMQAGRSNILADLSKALGTMRPDGSDSRMPVSRMPVGLIEYAASFFSSNSLNQVIIVLPFW